MFNNLKVAFEDKSNADLNRAYLLFKTINNPLISKALTKIVRLAMWLHLPISKIIKATVYKQFCGGITIDKCQNTINNLWKYKIGTILDFSAERKQKKNDLNNVMVETIKTINEAKNKESIPFAVFKPSGLASFNLLEKISLNKELSTEQKKERIEFEKRVECICKISYENKVPVFIDAEESWIQDAIDSISLKMMKKFNKKQTYIFNTIQLYRKDRIIYLNELIKNAKKNSFLIGVKLVRGAYHEKEIKRAEIMRYPCPVYKIKQDTDRDYNQAIKTCIKNIDIVSICAGTHNEESCMILIKLMKKYKIVKNDSRIHFSQLLGMSDHISYNCAKTGFNVSKYVPYGPVKDVFPYLIRRAEENTSISGQMGRELSNIITEKKRRKIRTKNHKPLDLH